MSKKSAKRRGKKKSLRSATPTLSRKANIARGQARDAERKAALARTEKETYEGFVEILTQGEEVPTFTFRTDPKIRGEVIPLRERIVAAGGTLRVSEERDADGYVEVQIAGHPAVAYGERLIHEGLLTIDDIARKPYLRWGEIPAPEAPATVAVQAPGGEDEGAPVTHPDIVAPDYDFSQTDGRDVLSWMPTATLASFSTLARERGFDKALTLEEVADLWPAGRHVVYSADLLALDGVHRIRAQMGLAVRDPSEPRSLVGLAAQRDVDFTVREWGIFMEGVSVSLPTHRALLDEWNDPGRDLAQRGGRPRPNADSVKPNWIGSRSFDRVWKTCSQWGMASLIYEQVTTGSAEHPAIVWRDHPEWEDVKRLVFEPDALLAMDAMERLQRAQVLAVSIDVFEGAPEWDDVATMWEWALGADLPFDPLYLDFTAPGLLCPLIDLLITHDGEGVRNGSLELRGALIWKEGDVLYVEPFGGPQGGAESPWMPHGRVVIGGPSPQADLSWERVRATDMLATSVIGVAHPRTRGGGAGRIETTTDHRLAAEGGNEVIGEYATMLMALAGRALATLSMLEAINVGTSDEPPAREDQRAIKRAQKRGWEVKIAPTVVVRPSGAGRKSSSSGSGTPREYSHAFTRRGHYAFYPLGTRVADRLVEENPNDKRLVNHPEKGLCRKVFRSQTVIGAQGGERQPIHKTRVWRTPPRGIVPATSTKEPS